MHTDIDDGWLDTIAFLCAVSSKKRELLSAQGPKNAFLIYPNAYGWSKIAWGGAAFSLLQVPRHSMQRTETNSKT